MKRKIATLMVLGSLAVTAIPANAYAYSWANETSSGIPQIYSPLFGSNVTATVGSSWNEPRVNEIHKGVDQSVSFVNVGSQWDTARVLWNDSATSGGNYQLIREYNSSTNKTFYSLYFHLSNWLINEDTVVTSSTYTAVSGNSGGVPAHLHYETLNYIDDTQTTSSGRSSALGNRTSVDPYNYMDNGIKAKRTVFKNFSVSSSGMYVRDIAIDAIDSNSYDDYLTDCELYYRQEGTSSWSGPNKMTSTGSGHFTYSLSGSSGLTYDVVIAGRRNSTETWVTYPAKHYTEVGTGSSISMNSWTDWEYSTVSF